MSDPARGDYPTLDDLLEHLDDLAELAAHAGYHRVCSRLTADRLIILTHRGAFERAGDAPPAPSSRPPK